MDFQLRATFAPDDEYSQNLLQKLARYVGLFVNTNEYPPPSGKNDDICLDCIKSATEHGGEYYVCRGVAKGATCRFGLHPRGRKDMSDAEHRAFLNRIKTWRNAFEINPAAAPLYDFYYNDLSDAFKKLNPNFPVREGEHRNRPPKRQSSGEDGDDERASRRKKSNKSPATGGAVMPTLKVMLSKIESVEGPESTFFKTLNEMEGEEQVQQVYEVYKLLTK